MKRMVLACSVVALLALGALTVVLFYTPGEPVPLGYVSCLSGKFSALSGSGRDGAILAVEHVNARGGVAGRPLELVIVDDGFDPDTARRAVKQLHSRGARAILGPFASAMAQPMLDAATEAAALLVSPTVTTDALTGRDDLFIRLMPPTADCSYALGRHMAEARGLRTVAALADVANVSYTQSVVQNIRQGFLDGGGERFEVVEYDSRTQQTCEKLIRSVLEIGAQGVALAASPLDSALAAQRLRMAKSEVPLFVATWSVSREFIENGGRAVEGVEAVAPFDPDCASPAYLAFAQEFARRYGRQPDYSSVFNYEAVMLLADALAKNPEARGEHLKRIVLDFGPRLGLQDGYVLDSAGDPIRPRHLLSVRDGRFVTAR